MNLECINIFAYLLNISFDKPTLFNIGIQHALIKDIPNLAVVSPASGFTGYASTVGRIVEYNVGVGQGIGIAASLAIATNRNLADIADLEVRNILKRDNQLPLIYGAKYTTEAARMRKFEDIMSRE